MLHRGSSGFVLGNELATWHHPARVLSILGERMDQYIEERRHASGVDLHYNDTIKPSDDAWRDCAAVLARRDLDNPMRQGWGGTFLFRTNRIP